MRNQVNNAEESDVINFITYDSLDQQSALRPLSLDIKIFPQKLTILLDSHLDRINTMLEDNHTYTWNNIMVPLEEMEDELERFWSPISHLHAVLHSIQLRACYEQCLPKLSNYESAISHNVRLYEAIKQINKSHLDTAQRKILKDSIEGFELSGVGLRGDKKKRFEEIQKNLSELSTRFSNNVLDATQSYSIFVSETEAGRLEGIPDYAVDAAKEKAAANNETGWRFSLSAPSYIAVMTHARDRLLRQSMHEAYLTRASDLSPSGKAYDNHPVLCDILKLREEKAKLLGFDNYAALSLTHKMAKTPKTVVTFLQSLITKAFPQAKKEFESLEDFALKQLGLSELKPWDIGYCSEQKSVAEYLFSQEELRAFFPEKRVVPGLFSIVQKLYGMQIEILPEVKLWHPEAQCCRIKDEQNRIRGYILMDLYARPTKREGAWMDSLQTRYKNASGEIQLPVATLTCNFAKPSSGKEPILSHDEVLTLFHEFGHCLQHVLTQVDYLSASGIQGVEWDAVELPSQFFENWCWEKEALDGLTEHWETKEPLPKALFDKMIAAKNFQSAMDMMRQLEFATFDLNIHMADTEELADIQPILADVRKQTRVVPTANYDRFQNTFSHIFAGGYAAGYYSYKWAEVLSSDAFERFEEEGLFNPETGRDFLHTILEVGGSKPAIEAFRAFRGRDPQNDALLRHCGIIGKV